MIFPDLRDAALEEVTRALAEAVGEDSLLRERAENLVAIALVENVNIDQLIEWIHYRTPEKDWSAEEFRNWARKLRETVEALNNLNRVTSCALLCPNCFDHLASPMANGRFWCPQCGRVP